MELPEKKALSTIRLEHVRECFDAAKSLVVAGQYNGRIDYPGIVVSIKSPVRRTEY